MSVCWSMISFHLHRKNPCSSNELRLGSISDQWEKRQHFSVKYFWNEKKSQRKIVELKFIRWVQFCEKRFKRHSLKKFFIKIVPSLDRKFCFSSMWLRSCWRKTKNFETNRRETNSIWNDRWKQRNEKEKFDFFHLNFTKNNIFSTIDYQRMLKKLWNKMIRDSNFLFSNNSWKFSGFERNL